MAVAAGVDRFANVPAMNEAIEAGWVIVATDYPGLGTSGGHAYLVGEDAARAVLDSVRAVLALADLKQDNNVVAEEGEVMLHIGRHRPSLRGVGERGER